MKIILKQNGILTVTREKRDKRIQKESTFYYKLAKAVGKAFGWNAIRKEMWKDGHLMDNGRFYLVDRKRRFAFYQNDWATYDICRDYFNCGKEVCLIPHDMRDDSHVPLTDWLKTPAAT